MRIRHCSECGAEGTASCDCGAPYLPAGMRASQALAAHPEKSNRAIAAEVGVGVETIRRARIARDPNGSPDKTIGLDGKAYPSRREKSPKQITASYSVEEDWLQSTPKWRGI
jgi:hypothetical protein